MKPTDLRGILQYVPRFRDRIFILAMDGSMVAHENFSNILLDVAVLRSLNIRVVLVHGASAQIQELARAENREVPFNDGTGVTDAASLRMAVTASQQVTHKLLEGLASNSQRAALTNGIVAYPMGILQGQDYLFTGKVEKVDAGLFQDLLNQGVIPVVPPLGFDGEGHTYRVNSDAIALALALSLKAAKLIFITPQDGLYIDGQLQRQILAADLEQQLRSGKASVDPVMVSKAHHAVRACLGGVNRVHLINGTVDEGLLTEVFSNEGVGTLIYANEYQQIRPALKKDIRPILQLTKNSILNEELVRRTRATLEKEIQDYYIYEIDRNPVACVALHHYPDSGKGELAFLCVNPSHENQGIGRKLIKFVENKARDSGLKELLVLSTQAFTFFQSKAGFSEGSPDDLPPERRERYDQSGRNSRVLVKSL